MKTQDLAKLQKDMESESESAYRYGKESKYYPYEVYTFVIKGSDVYLESEDGGHFGVSFDDWYKACEYAQTYTLRRNSHIALILSKEKRAYAGRPIPTVDILSNSRTEGYFRLGGRVEKHLTNEGIAFFEDYIDDDPAFDAYSRVLTRATLHQYLYDTCVTLLDS